MNDERIVEVMAQGMHNSNHCPSDGPETWLPEAGAALTALRSDGFEVYRPDECEVVEVIHNGLHNMAWVRDGWSHPTDLPDQGTYHLVTAAREKPYEGHKPCPDCWGDVLPLTAEAPTGPIEVVRCETCGGTPWLLPPEVEKP